MYIFSNPNPCKTLVGDCVVRALSLVENDTWESVYGELCELGYYMCDMPSSNEVWGEYLDIKGYNRYSIPNPFTTVHDFCRQHRKGTYVLGTGSHVVAVIDGNHYDTWDSKDETPVYYWQKEI